MKFLLFFTILAGCATTREIKNVKVWQANPNTQSIIRKQDNSEISCVDKQFEQFICLDVEDFKTFVSECKP